METPGNWTVIDRSACGEGFAVVSDHDFAGANGTYHRRYVAQFLTEEDAALVASAPELRDALVRLYGGVCQQFSEVPAPLRDAMIEAFQALGEPGA